MKCFPADLIYLYLEGELSSPDEKHFKQHLEECKGCREAVEERVILLEAAESLPVWDVPEDFTHSIMDRIFPEKVYSFKWFAAAASALVFASFSLFLYFILSGQNLTHLFVTMNQSLLKFIQTTAVTFVKFFKLAYLFIRIIFQSLSALLKSIAQVANFISPEMQLFLIILTILLAASLFFGVRRILLSGEAT
jgi:hypothetical protein